NIFPIAVNISACQLRENNFVGKVSQILQESKFLPEDLTLEITETAALKDLEVTVKVLKGLHRLGVQIAIDDFGSGYFSLNLLRKPSFLKYLIYLQSPAGLILLNNKVLQSSIRIFFFLFHP
ncbi:unnamed protein product, partial [marine sediment metagenome]